MKASGIWLLTNSSKQDFVTEILKSVTLKAVVFGRTELRAPWGVRVHLPGKAFFHVVLRGQCWTTIHGSAPIRLEEGDTILFPRADAHDIFDHHASPVRTLREMLVEHPKSSEGKFRWGGSGTSTTLLCGAFQIDDPKLNLLGTLLPSFLHLKGDSNTTSVQLHALMQVIEAELQERRPGEQAIVTRMAEAFLLRAIRDHVLSSANGGSALSAVLRDRALGRVLGEIHRRPEHLWTLNGLSREANLSRSAFAARFKMCLGTTPQRYLQQYRFSKAAQLLRTTDAKISDIARRVGYLSETSFIKAFKREIGATPSSYRQKRSINGMITSRRHTVL